MGSPARDLMDYLISAGLGTAGDTFYLDRGPADPKKIVAIVRDSGTWRPANDSTKEYYPNVQILVRGTRGANKGIWNFCVQIRDALISIRPMSINGSWYGGVMCRSGPASIGPDESDRPVYSINFNLIRGTN